PGRVGQRQHLQYEMTLREAFRGVGVESKRCPVLIRLHQASIMAATEPTDTREPQARTELKETKGAAGEDGTDGAGDIVIGDSTWKEILDSHAPEYDKWAGVRTDEGKVARKKIHDAVMESLEGRKIFSNKIDGNLVELSRAEIRQRVSNHLRMRSSAWKEYVKSYNKAYRHENRDEILAYKKRYHQENRDAILAYYKRYHWENRDARLAQMSRYDQENRERILAKRKDERRYERSRQSKATAESLRSRQREYRSSQSESLRAKHLLFPELEHVQSEVKGKLVIDFVTPFPDDPEDKPTLNDSDALTKYGVTSGSEFIYPARVHVSQVHPRDLQRTEGKALLLPNKRIDEQTKIKAGIWGMWQGSGRSDHDNVYAGVDVALGIRFHFRKWQRRFKWLAGGKVYAYLIFSTNDM
ncbi:hypothetical protein THAOC_35676, partial [Thalassiosira oceanica]